MKLKFCYALLFLNLILYAQKKPKLYVKGNVILLPIGVVNLGLEYKLNKKYTLQTNVLISPWKSIKGNHMQIYMGNLEGRYYFNQAFKHWYVGLNAGIGFFNITKWNYWNTNQYQKGFNLMVGGVVGYQMRLNRRWNLDFYLGGGYSQSFYHGYETQHEPPGYFRYDPAIKWNKSSEAIPFEGGLMLSYKLK